MTTTTTEPRKRTAAAIVPVIVDLICVVAFAAGGKSAHEASSTWWVLFKIAWPYALACLVIHDILWRLRLRPARVFPGGTMVLVFTYVVGMLLRAVTGRGIALGFLIVAAAFLIITMIGWRLLWSWWRTRRSAT